MDVRAEQLIFSNRSGEQLSGRLERPDFEPRAYAIFAHCFTCSKDAHAASRVSRALCREGVAVLRFDFTGLGNSAGDFSNTNFSSNIEDLLAAADYLREHHAAPRLLVGHSLGGAAVLVAGARIPETAAVATIGAPSEPRHLQRFLAGDLDTVRQSGEATITLGGRQFRIKKQFLEDLETQRLTEDIRALRKPLLVFHSPVDEIVGIDHARGIFDAARHPKSFISLDNADHLLSKREDSEYVATVLAAWATRYLPPEPADQRATGSAAGEEGLVTVRARGKSLAQTIVAGRHELRADEPLSVGGDDSGATPYDLLLAALGACTSMTLRLYANHKGWPLEEIAVTLQHSKIHARDCESCETREGKIDRIERRIALGGPLDAEQRARLIEIAGRCPVHRTLVSENEIVTREETREESVA